MGREVLKLNRVCRLSEAAVSFRTCAMCTFVCNLFSLDRPRMQIAEMTRQQNMLKKELLGIKLEKIHAITRQFSDEKGDRAAAAVVSSRATRRALSWCCVFVCLFACLRVCW